MRTFDRRTKRIASALTAVVLAVGLAGCHNYYDEHSEARVDYMTFDRRLPDGMETVFNDCMAPLTLAHGMAKVDPEPMGTDPCRPGNLTSGSLSRAAFGVATAVQQDSLTFDTIPRKVVQDTQTTHLPKPINCDVSMEYRGFFEDVSIDGIEAGWSSGSRGPSFVLTGDLGSEKVGSFAVDTWADCSMAKLFPQRKKQKAESIMSDLEKVFVGSSDVDIRNMSVTGTLVFAVENDSVAVDTVVTDVQLDELTLGVDWQAVEDVNRSAGTEVVDRRMIVDTTEARLVRSLETRMKPYGSRVGRQVEGRLNAEIDSGHVACEVRVDGDSLVLVTDGPMDDPMRFRPKCAKDDVTEPPELMSVQPRDGAHIDSTHSGPISLRPRFSTFMGGKKYCCVERVVDQVDFEFEVIDETGRRIHGNRETVHPGPNQGVVALVHEMDWTRAYPGGEVRWSVTAWNTDDDWKGDSEKMNSKTFVVHLEPEPSAGDGDGGEEGGTDDLSYWEKIRRAQDLEEAWEASHAVEAFAGVRDRTGTTECALADSDCGGSSTFPSTVGDLEGADYGGQPEACVGRLQSVFQAVQGSGSATELEGALGEVQRSARQAPSGERCGAIGSGGSMQVLSGSAPAPASGDGERTLLDGAIEVAVATARAFDPASGEGPSAWRSFGFVAEPVVLESEADFRTPTRMALRGFLTVMTSAEGGVDVELDVPRVRTEAMERIGVGGDAPPLPPAELAFDGAVYGALIGALQEMRRVGFGPGG